LFYGLEILIVFHRQLPPQETFSSRFKGFPDQCVILALEVPLQAFLAMGVTDGVSPKYIACGGPASALRAECVCRKEPQPGTFT
jgi:hypothetical protein